MFRMSSLLLIDQAKDFHHLARVKFYSGWKTTPLLSGYVNFHPPEYLSNLAESISKSVSPCELTTGYLKYLDSCKPGEVAPVIQGCVDPPLDFDLLPGKVPVLDHLKCILESQPEYEAGGSFVHFLSKNIQTCCNYRQMSTELKPKVKTILFGQASKNELINFIADFNLAISEQSKASAERFPINFYHLEVEYVYGSCNKSFFKKSYPMTEPVVIPSVEGKIPARIVLSTWDRTWEIVYPWICTTETSPFTGKYLMQVPQPLPASWANIFDKLKGFPIGINLKDKIQDLNDFQTKVFKFINHDGYMNPKSLDLNVILALAGFNCSTVSEASLAHIFTGGYLPTPWEFKLGYGLSAEYDIPDFLRCYLHSKAISILNASMISILAYFILIFPTPGIGALCTKKDPVKLMEWFSTFLIDFCKGHSLHKHVIEIDRCDEPNLIFNKISKVSGEKCVFGPSDMEKIHPVWNSVSFGGCTTDQTAISHILEKVHPVICRPEVPNHLKWGSNLKIISNK